MEMKEKSFVVFWNTILQRTIRKSSRALIFLFLFSLPPGVTTGHGSLHEAIERKSRQIDENPEDALLRFERGMLYQEHGDIGLALGDFHEVLRMEPSYYACHLPLAQLYRDTGAVEQALAHLGYFLEQEPDNPFGYETRASIYQRSGEHLKAASDLRRMIALKNDNAIRPDDYFNLADGLLAAYPGKYELAIEALEEGLKRLGNIISLQSRLVDLEIAAQRYPAALQRIEQIMKPLPRKDKWLAKKAEAIRLMQQQRAEVGSRKAEVGSGKAEGGRQNEPQDERQTLLFQFPPSNFAFKHGRQSETGSSPVLVDVIRGPYLQSGTPTGMVVKWRTSTSTNSVVWYGDSPASLNQVAEQSGARIDHEITLSGLQPNTRYYYAIGDDSGVLAGGSPNHFFQTSPPHGAVQPVRAWVLGDCGTANDDARAVRDGYYAYAGSSQTDLILLLGDNAYDDGTDGEYQEAIFENMYEDQLIKTVIWSTPGNHDYESASAASQTGPYFDIFTFPKNGEAGGLPSGTEAYYSFDYANIHFIVLDSHDSGREPGGPMLTWLENDLDATQQDWIIAFFHHPPYSKGSHDSDDESKLIEMRENVLPILEAAGVDLVLSGHSHSYERSYLLNGHYGNSNSLEPSMILDAGDGRLDGNGAYQKNEAGDIAGRGAVYTVAGSSGKTSSGPLDHPVMYYSARTLGSLSLEVVDQQLDLKFIGVDGEVLDYFTINKFTPIGNPPAVMVSSPADGAYYPSIVPVTLGAEASDSDGFIEEITFFVNGDSVGVDQNVPYTLSWTPPANGSYFVKARARDNDGNVVISAEQSFRVGVIEVCSRVSGRENDAEEDLNGNMSLSSTDLEMINDSSDGDQWVGMRFTGLNIPPDAIISKAWIQFTVEDTDNDDPCRLFIYGEASGSPAPFSSSDNDISSRPLTQAMVTWEPPIWQEIGDRGEAQQTPNLAPILQEAITREGYSASSPVVIIIQGQGRRTAESFDGKPQYAPLLCVEYQFCQSSPLSIGSSVSEACPGQPVTLSAGPAASYLWSTGATTAQAVVQPLETTTYSLTAWDENGCPATAEVTVNVLPAPQLDLGTDAVSFCPGQGTEVTAPAGFAQYLWSNGQTSPNVFIDSPGTWTLTVTGANGCTASASLEASLGSFPNLQVSSTAAGICPGQTATLSASPASGYLWNTGATTRQIVVQPSETTTYEATAWDENGCFASAEFTLEVFPSPEISFGTDTLFFCPGQEAEAAAPDGFARYEWSDGQTSPAVFVDSPGAWSLTVTDANGCTASAGFEAAESPPLNLQATGSATEACAGKVITLSASPAGNYQWSTGDTTAQAVVQPSQTTTYSVTAWEANGCRETAEVTITIYPLPEFEIEEEDGRLSIVGLANPGQYSFFWNSGENTSAITPAASGQYCATVFDANGCASAKCYDFLATGTVGPSPSMPWEVFPNPFEEEARIRPARAQDKLQVLVFNLLGQPVPFQLIRTEGEIVLKFMNLPSGLYTIAISNGEITRAVKMLKR